MIASMSTRSFRSNRFCAAVAVLASLLASAPAAAQVNTPVISSVEPNTASAGEAAVIITVTGAGFVSGSVIYWGTQPLSTSSLGLNQLTATLRPEMLTAPGQFSITVLNPNGARSMFAAFTVTGSTVSVITESLPAAAAGVAYSQTLAASGGTTPYIWTPVDGVPPGLTLNPSGQLSGTPSTTGSFSFTVRVTDAAQRTAVKLLTLSVTAQSLTIGTPAALPPATEGMPYSQVLSAANGTSPYVWSAGQGVPPGMALNPTTGALAGTPTTRGSYSFEVHLTDGASKTATKAFTLTVQGSPLSITTVSPLFAGSVGTAYSQTFSVAGGAEPYVWTMRPAVSGLTLNPSAGVLSGTPDQAGTYALTVQVSDSSGLTASKDLVLNVTQPQISITNGASLPAGTAGKDYQQRFLATGGKPPYQWSISSGNAPGTIDSSTGVFSASAPSVGTFTFNVTVRDSASETATRAFNLTVSAGPLRLEPPAETLKNVIGNPFSVTLPVSGGTPPYSWAANGLPEGLELDAATGAVSGSFRTVGSFLFTLRVTDASRATATELVQVDVTAPRLPVLRIPDVPETAEAATQIGTPLQISEAYSLPLSGQLVLSFTPESGSPGDPSIQFSTGGRTVDFQIPAGAVQAQFSTPSLGLQTGTVAGTITLSARLQTGSVVITPTPVSVQTIQVNRSAPVITAAAFTRNGSTIEVRVTGYSTTREITQGVFQFQASGGNTLTTSDITLPLEEPFSRWFRDSASVPYGGQFSFTQQFTIQGDANAVTPVSVTLTNRTGSKASAIRP